MPAFTVFLSKPRQSSVTHLYNILLHFYNWFLPSSVFTNSRLQELLKFEEHEEGRVPRTVECELTEDLVDLCIPGDVVTVTGIIRVINNYMDIGGGTIKGFLWN